MFAPFREWPFNTGKGGDWENWGKGIISPWKKGLNCFFMPHWQIFLINVIKKAVFMKNNIIWIYKIQARGG